MLLRQLARQMCSSKTLTVTLTKVVDASRQSKVWCITTMRANRWSEKKWAMQATSNCARWTIRSPSSSKRLKTYAKKRAAWPNSIWAKRSALKSTRLKKQTMRNVMLSCARWSVSTRPSIESSLWRAATTTSRIEGSSLSSQMLMTTSLSWRKPFDSRNSHRSQAPNWVRTSYVTSYLPQVVRILNSVSILSTWIRSIK